MTDETIETLAHDLRLIRVQIEKHEIPIDRKLSEQLQAAFRYSPKDNLRAHIPSKTITSRGSVVWQVIDLKQSNVRWLERRYIADRVLAL